MSTQEPLQSIKVRAVRSSGHALIGSAEPVVGISALRLRHSHRAPLLGALFVVYGFIALISVRRGWPVLCPFRLVTGRRCPLCGISTALACTLERDVRGTQRAHPLGMVMAKALGAPRKGQRSPEIFTR